jgi:hypothetical protein
MEINVDLNREDYLKFNKYVILKNRIKRSFIIATIFIIIWIIILNKDIPFNLPLILIETIIFYLGWGVIFLIIYSINFNKIKRMPDENGSILGSKKYIILEEGFKEITDVSESITKWTGIKKLVENKEYIYLFVDKIAAFVIPKRYFDSNSQMDDFIKLINNKINVPQHAV